MLYELIPNMPEHRLVPLIEKFAEAVSMQVRSSQQSRPRNEGMG
jgi:hypothetical protein